MAERSPSSWGNEFSRHEGGLGDTSEPPVQGVGVIRSYVARGKAPRGRKMNGKAEEHSEAGSSVSKNQELTVVDRLTSEMDRVL